MNIHFGKDELFDSHQQNVKEWQGRLSCDLKLLSKAFAVDRGFGFFVSRKDFGVPAGCQFRLNSISSSWLNSNESQNGKYCYCTGKSPNRKNNNKMENSFLL